MTNILYKDGKYYNLEGRNPKKPLSIAYGRGLYNKQQPKTVKSEVGYNIRFINEKYYNDNGTNPNKPLSVPYAKRLLRNQVLYGKSISIKDASGKGKLKAKSKALKKIKDKSTSVRDIKRNVEIVNKTDYQQFLKDIANKKIDTKNLRTRFRAGFRVYHDDTPQYDSITRATAKDGVIPIQRFLNDLPNDVFSNQSRGSLRYVIYDKVTKKVYHDMNYDVDINDDNNM